MNALDALNRARGAWEKSQPQLSFALWDDELERGAAAQCPVGLPLEPATPRNSPSRVRGLNNGADPSCGTDEELTAAPSPGANAPATADTDGSRVLGAYTPAEALVAAVEPSAGLSLYGPGRKTPEESLRGQGQEGA